MFLAGLPKIRAQILRIKGSFVESLGYNRHFESVIYSPFHFQLRNLTQIFKETKIVFRCNGKLSIYNFCIMDKINSIKLLDQRSEIT